MKIILLCVADPGLKLEKFIANLQTYIRNVISHMKLQLA